MTHPRRIAGVLLVLGCMTAGQARATVNRFQGSARIELHERLEAADPYAIATTVVTLDMRIDGAESVAGSAGVGSATISGLDGDVTIALLANQMSPPAGSGGRVFASGVGNDGNGYCFDVRDLVDAPTPREDRIIAAFGPLDENGILMPWTHCASLLYLEDYVLDGDFAFTQTV